MATDTEVQHKRATVRPDKGDAVTAMVESFRSSSAALLTEYRGLTVKQITALRVALGADTTYSVVKNSLTQIAAREAGLSGLDELLVGPVAVAFVGGDPVAAAKGLRDFAKTNPALVVKGGVMDGRALSADEIKKLADLESREVLLAKMAGAMKASLTQAVYLLAAPLAQAARAIGALEAKAQQDPSVLAGGAGTPAPVAEDTPTEDTPTEDVVVVETEPADAGEVSAVADEAPVAELADVTLEAADGSADSTTDTPA
ncbi:MAG: 50S ribosomal protein L10 [Pseudorhodobacter sp.]|nr:50S ribosomal protein L10 [Frankiaceae bacterium]